jgi:predicted nuclease of predicted toxin-antitoxin system
MRFLIDRCAGKLLADTLRPAGHDVVESRDLGPDPGDEALLELAVADKRILVTIDTDFGQLVFVQRARHFGLVRLPDVPAVQRVSLMTQLLVRYSKELESGSIVTVRGGRVRISQSP